MRVTAMRELQNYCCEAGKILLILVEVYAGIALAVWACFSAIDLVVLDLAAPVVRETAAIIFMLLVLVFAVSVG